MGDSEVLYEGSDCADKEDAHLENDDTWEVFDDGVIRNHTTPRMHFFDPSENADLPCPLARLGPRRITTIRPLDSQGPPIVEEHTDWRDEMVKASDIGRGLWLGTSFFPYADVAYIPEKVVEVGEVGWDPEHPTAKFADKPGWVLEFGRWTGVLSGSSRPPSIPP